MGRLANTLIPARQSGLVNIGRESLRRWQGLIECRSAWILFLACSRVVCNAMSSRRITGSVPWRWSWLGVAILFCVCVLLKLNGSSVGIWTQLLNEPKPLPGLLLFIPKGVGADEWHGWTPAVLSQSRQTPRFPVENLTLGGGRAPLLMSVPVAYYTTLFRPQLWGFFPSISSAVFRSTGA